MKLAAIVFILLAIHVTGFTATLDVPTDFSTIQDAIDAAVDGDIVLVAPGTYVENIDYLGKAVTVKSNDGPGATMIDGQAQAASVVRFMSGEGPDSVLEGFTLTNGAGIDYFFWGKCGGGVYCDQASPTLVNNIITGNGASYGGGIACFGNSAPTIHYLTFAENVAAKAGEAMCIQSSNPVIKHSILWGTTAGLTNSSITYSCIQGGCPGTGNIDQDPLFLDAAGGDFRLQQHPCQSGIVNPCVDAGDPASPLPEGTTRMDFGPDQGVVDMGCHYRGNFYTVPDDYPTIQAAIDAVTGAGCIHVRAGTYMENIDFKGKIISLVGVDGPAVTVIDGNQTGPVAILDCIPYAWIEGFTLRNGLAMNGGGIFCFLTKLTLWNNVITANSSSGHGGGVYCGDGSLTLEANHIHYNTCSLNGGGIYMFGESLMLQGNRVHGNTADGNGGGLACFHADSSTLEDNQLHGNTADASGGGIYCEGASPALLCNTLHDNLAGESGGGLACVQASPHLDSNILFNNEADSGGGMGFQQSSPTIVNSMIFGNHAASGGGITLDDLSVPTLTNNTLFGNSAFASGGGMDCGNGAATVTNCIFWHNASPAGSQIHGPYAQVTCSCVEGGWPGTGNLDGNPLFKNPTIHDFHLTLDSPCMNKGDCWAPALPDMDYEGDGRICYSSVDMGADEYNLGGGVTLLVPELYATITDAIEMALDGDVVLAAPGTYRENISFLGKSITVKGADGAHATVIDGGGFWGNSTVVTFAAGEGPDSVLEGFTITNGWAKYGGGISCVDASPTIRNNIIKDNFACAWEGDRNGGGIFCDRGAPLITDNIICANGGGVSGGGIHCGGGGAPLIENNRIFGNHASGGGGISIGDMYGDTASPIIRNNIIHDNKAIAFGGGIGFSAEPSGWPPDGKGFNNVTIVNNTLFGNTAKIFGGGGIACIAGSFRLENTILWNNQSSLGTEILVGHDWCDPATLSVCHSNVEGGQPSTHVHPGCNLDWGPGNIDSNPLFVRLARGDFHLTFNSPCRGSGNSVASGLPDTDFEGDPRIAYGTVDMGADEFHPHLYYTGNATPSGTIQAKFVGLPGTWIDGVILGFNIFDPPLSCDYGLWCIDNPMQIITGLGTIPSSGVAVFPGRLPSTPLAPYTIYLQAAIDSWLTNLCPVNVQ